MNRLNTVIASVAKQSILTRWSCLLRVGRLVALTSLSFFLITTLTSCGFHLRGTQSRAEDTPQALRIIYLQSNSPYAQFENILRQNLRGYNIQTIDEPDHHLILRIINYNLNQSTGSVSSNLQTRQYVVTFTVNFELLAPDGKVLLGPTSVTSMTTFTANLSQMLVATNNITQQYSLGLYNDAAFRLSSRLVAEDTRKAIAAYYHK